MQGTRTKASKLSSISGKGHGKPTTRAGRKKKDIELGAVETLEGVMDLAAASAEEILPIALRAHKLSAIEYTYREIGPLLQKEFNLPSPPSPTMICRWITETRTAMLSDMRALQLQELVKCLELCNETIRKFAPIALAGAGEINVRRAEKQDGETVIVLDEDAFSEQVKANQECMKAIAIRADILGLRDGAMFKDKSGATPEDVLAFIGALARAQTSGAAELKPANVLELSSGLQEAV